MPGSSFGTMFKVTTFGESHGLALGCVVDGCPPGLELCEEDLQRDLDRRKPGTSKYTTQRKEDDKVTILSGLFEGKTTGTPIGLIIHNSNQKTKDYTDIKDLFRPAHADFTYEKKFGIRDYRGGGRASARETTMRVAAGGIARKYLMDRYGIQIQGCLLQMGDIVAEKFDWSEVDNNPFFCPDVSVVGDMEALIDDLRRDGDSIGAKVMVTARGMVAGLGEPVFDKLDASIAGAMMSINAVKGVEIGAGFSSVAQRGSEHRDEIRPTGFQSNNAGGILGGISSGQDILVNLALKPTSSITQPVRTIDRHGNDAEISTKGRHDPCVGVRATPIAEAMLALVIMDEALKHRAQNQDVVSNLPNLS